MRNNQPITQQEKEFSADTRLVSMTDLQGDITFVNLDFLRISGFNEQELLGSHHNIVRHPDMPPAAFADLWRTIKAGKTWRGLVKNRCKNGDHYWVDAYVMPIVQDGETVGYQSVRSKPSRAQVTEAEQLYARMRKDPSLTLPTKKGWQHVSLALKGWLLGGIAVASSSVLLLDELFGFTDPANPLIEDLFTLLHLLNMLAAFALVGLLYYEVIKPLRRCAHYLVDIANGDLTESLPDMPHNETGQIMLGNPDDSVAVTRHLRTFWGSNIRALQLGRPVSRHLTHHESRRQRTSRQCRGDLGLYGADVGLYRAKYRKLEAY